jgi:hypothetical protein
LGVGQVVVVKLLDDVAEAAVQLTTGTFVVVMAGGQLTAV